MCVSADDVSAMASFSAGSSSGSSDGSRSASSSDGGGSAVPSVSSVGLSDPAAAAAAPARTTGCFPMEIDDPPHPPAPQTVVGVSQQPIDHPNATNRPVMVASVAAAAAASSVSAVDGKRKHTDMSRVLTDEPQVVAAATAATSSHSRLSLQGQRRDDQGMGTDVVTSSNTLF